MCRNLHNFISAQLPVLVSALVVIITLFAAALNVSTAHAAWDNEYDDLFGPSNSPADHSSDSSQQPKEEPAAFSLEEQSSNQQPQRQRRSNSGLFPSVSSLGNTPMHGVSVSKALPRYRSASSKETLTWAYKKNRNKPFWVRRKNVIKDANATIQLLLEADYHGLNPAEYHVDEILQAQQDGDLTLFDLLLTDNSLRFASHLRDGQYEPNKVDSMWLMSSGPRAALLEGMVRVLRSQSASRHIRQLAPTGEVYQHLQRHLRDYLSIAKSGGWPSYPLRGGSNTTKLRARLAVTDGTNLKTALKRFQRRHGLNEDGVVGGRTRQALAVPVNKRIRQIMTAMERWRWMPNELPRRLILVNVPAFRLYYREGGVDKLTMRTIVGMAKENQQTPTFTTNMQYMVLNPNWNVPGDIVSEEMAPRASQNSRYFQDRGYKVIDQAGNEVNPSKVRWSQYSRNNPAPYRVFQARGGDGALGLVKFIFPNQYGVAIHDTKKKSLFKEEFRAFSHGCVRIEKPLDLGAALLGQRSSKQFSSLVKKSGEDERIDLRQNLPVYVLYMTAWADKKDVYFYEDLYRRDRLLVRATPNRR